MDHKRKIKECVEAFEQQLKVIMLEIPKDEPKDLEEIAFILKFIRRVNFSTSLSSKTLYYARITGLCRGRRYGGTLPLDLDFVFDDYATFERVRKDANHGVIISLFDKHMQERHECWLDLKILNRFTEITEKEAQHPIFVQKFLYQ